ncbi:hypothetical protein ZWY2020_021401 [Hordeum vulgare]|nr:hypothetical protein ZWY2020_021401 [Hordeum vulgare]
MAPPPLNLAGSARIHIKSAENGSTPAKSSRIRPSPAVVAIGGPSRRLKQPPPPCTLRTRTTPAGGRREADLVRMQRGR